MSENIESVIDQGAPTAGILAETTPLNALHLELGARMVPFAGYSMPLQYSTGIMTEHLHTRSACGVFDVSHMGQIRLRPHSGLVQDAALALERLVPADIASLAPGRQRYALLTNPAGGVMDDLMVACMDDSLLLVVNASCKHADLAHLEQHLSRDCVVEPMFDRGLLAVQGPGAEAALSVLDANVASMRFMDVRTVLVDGQACTISRSGYTGEDGYEIGTPAALAEPIARLLLAQPGVLPVGLGARDSLRLEAGLCLYGNDIDTTTTPVEAGLEWAIQKSRRYGGSRAGGFPGADIILRELVDGTGLRRVGLRPAGRAPLREGAPLFSPGAPEAVVGRVSSGAFGPSLQAPVAMGYIPIALAQPGTALVAELRGRHVPVTVCPMPFVPPNFKR